MTQYVSREKHLRALESKRKKEGTRTLLNNTPKYSFNTDLCTAMVPANIPLFKIKNANFRNFLLKYTGQNISKESILRKNYLGDCYSNTINSIRAYVENIKL